MNVKHLFGSPARRVWGKKRRLFSFSRFLWSICLCCAAWNFHVPTAGLYAVFSEVERIHTNIVIERAPLPGTFTKDTSFVSRALRKRPVNRGALTPEYWSKPQVNPTMFRSKLDFYCNVSSRQRISLRGIKLKSSVTTNLPHRQFLNFLASA